MTRKMLGVKIYNEKIYKYRSMDKYPIGMKYFGKKTQKQNHEDLKWQYNINVNGDRSIRLPDKWYQSQVYLNLREFKVKIIHVKKIYM